MAQFPQSFGTAFAVAGFSFDPNLSPNNQSFANAVLATVQRAGLPFGFEAANVVLAGPASGAAALPTYRALVAADVPGGVNGFGNPTNKVSGTATNGTSTLAMRSDGAPALDWAQAPTWTGLHTFTPASGIGVTINGLAGSDGLRVAGDQALISIRNSALAVVGQLAPLKGWIGSGTATSDFAIGAVASLRLYAAGGTNATMRLFGTGAGQGIDGWGPNAGGAVDMTPDTGSFNGTLTGFTTTINPACVWSRQGNQVILFISAAVGTSNATTFTMTGLPAAIQTARTLSAAVSPLEDATAFTGTDFAASFSGGTVSFLKSGSGSAWTASGTKGLSLGVCISYMLN